MIRTMYSAPIIIKIGMVYVRIDENWTITWAFS